MFKITGLETLSQSLQEAQEALSNLDGELTPVRFGSTEPASIEAAIQEMERVIDERVGRYADNPFVAPLVAATKERYRQAILDGAAATRVAGNGG